MVDCLSNGVKDMMEDQYEWRVISTVSQVNQLMDLLSKKHVKESRLKDALKRYSLLFMYWDYNPRHYRSGVIKGKNMEELPLEYEEKFEGIQELEKMFSLYYKKKKEDTPLKQFVGKMLERVRLLVWF